MVLMLLGLRYNIRWLNSCRRSFTTMRANPASLNNWSKKSEQETGCTRLCSVLVKISSSSDTSWLVAVGLSRQLEILQRRFKEHRDLTQQANEAIKTQNHLLSKEVSSHHHLSFITELIWVLLTSLTLLFLIQLERVETKSKEQLAMKSEVISNLEVTLMLASLFAGLLSNIICICLGKKKQRELDTLRAAYKSVLQQQSPQLNRSPPPKDPRTVLMNHNITLLCPCFFLFLTRTHIMWTFCRSNCIRPWEMSLNKLNASTYCSKSHFFLWHTT